MTNPPLDPIHPPGPVSPTEHEPRDPEASPRPDPDPHGPDLNDPDRELPGDGSG